MIINPEVQRLITEHNLNPQEVYLFFLIYSFVKYDPRIVNVITTPLKDGKYVLNLDNEEKYRVLFLKASDTNGLSFKHPLLIEEGESASYKQFCQKLDATKVFGTNGHLNNQVPYRVYAKNAELKSAVEKLPAIDIDKAITVVINYYLRTPQPPGLVRFLNESFMIEYELEP